MTLGSESDPCFVSGIEYLTIKAVSSSEARSKYELNAPVPKQWELYALKVIFKLA